MAQIDETKIADMEPLPPIDDLSKIADQAKAAAAASVIPEGAAAATSTFAGGAATGAKREKSPEDKRISHGISTVKRVLTDKANQQKGSPRDRAREIMEKYTRCCGYVVHTDAKIDFATTRVKDTKTVDLVVKNSPPSAVTGFVVTYPQSIKAFIADDESAKVAADIDKIVNDYDERPGATVVDIISREDMSNFIGVYCGNYVKEAEDIFVPFIKKGRGGVTAFNRYNDPEQFAKTGGSVGLQRYVQISGLSDDKVRVKVRHSMRPRFIAPGNYIAERKYDAFSPAGRTFTEDEAKELNKQYFGKFMQGTKRNGVVQPSKYASFSVKSRSLIKKGQDDVITSDFFNENAANTWGNLQVPHWYEKDSAGAPVVLTGKDIQLVAKEFKIRADHTPSDRASLVSRPLVSEDVADPDAYRWNPNSKVVKATGGKLTFQKYMEYYDTRKSAAKPAGKSAQITNIGGLDDETIKLLFKQAVVSV